MAGLSEGEQNRLIQDHVELASRLAAGYRGSKNIPFEDIEAQAMLGLVQAARNYDSVLSKFSTHATNRIQWAIGDLIRNWQDAEALPVGDELEERVHEWQMWGGFPYEGWHKLPASPEEILELFEDVEGKTLAIENAFRDLKPRERRMISAHFLRTPAVKLESIARDEKISYFRAVEIIYDAMKKLRANVLKQEERRDNVIPFRSAPRSVMYAGVKFA